jgi:hypothetical protein
MNVRRLARITASVKNPLPLLLDYSQLARKPYKVPPDGRDRDSPASRPNLGGFYRVHGVPSTAGSLSAQPYGRRSRTTHSLLGRSQTIRGSRNGAKA